MRHPQCGCQGPLAPTLQRRTEIGEENTAGAMKAPRHPYPSRVSAPTNPQSSLYFCSAHCTRGWLGFLHLDRRNFHSIENIRNFCPPVPSPLSVGFEGSIRGRPLCTPSRQPPGRTHCPFCHIRAHTSQSQTPTDIHAPSPIC